MDKFFKITERKSSVRTEILAGVTTFLTMAYILAVNPGILSATGMDFGRVFTATALSGAIATLVMGLLANLPFALAPGMGLNAFLTYTVVLGMGKSWEFALAAVFVEGIIFIILTATNVREAIVNSIPANMKKAISAGIGLFIAFIGLQNAGIIVNSDATLVVLNPTWFKGAPLLAVIGLVLIAVLSYKKVTGSILIGMLIVTVLGIPLGVTAYAGGSFAPSAPYFFPFFNTTSFQASQMLSLDFVIVCFTFLFVDMFDTVGTLIGCATKAGMIKEDGKIPNVKEALFADAIGTTCGAILGTSTVTTFVESSAGVVEGGRTGLTAITVAVLFLVSLFLGPIFESIPSAATGAALVYVGALMITPVTDIDFTDITEAVPAFLCILFMVCAYSISDGIMFGILSYVIIKLFCGKKEDITPMTIIVAVLFLIKILVSAL
ncbi:MAG: NCS2 family permease [Sphaerochaetaceae bacterium]|nr:NCS2 family permease [Sphaerochaetaceae bacterium]